MSKIALQWESKNFEIIILKLLWKILIIDMGNSIYFNLYVKAFTLYWYASNLDSFILFTLLRIPTKQVTGLYKGTEVYMNGCSQDFMLAKTL